MMPATGLTYLLQCTGELPLGIARHKTESLQSLTLAVLKNLLCRRHLEVLLGLWRWPCWWKRLVLPRPAGKLQHAREIEIFTLKP
jgi:hypothetical protein